MRSFPWLFLRAKTGFRPYILCVPWLKIKLLQRNAHLQQSSSPMGMKNWHFVKYHYTILNPKLQYAWIGRDLSLLCASVPLCLKQLTF